MQPDNLTYKDVLRLSQKHLDKGRPESAAFLNWFLEEMFNLDDVDADDCICDGQYDQGIDAIYVSDVDQEIVFFQSKLTQNFAKTLGDVSLKEFVGSLGQFATPDQAAAVSNTTKNPELKKLLERTKVAEKLAAGYTTKGVFVTNSANDENAVAFLKHHQNVVVFDRNRIAAEFIEINAPEGVNETSTLNVFEGLMLVYEAGNQATMYQFIAPAGDIVALSGIGDHTIFAQNVRLPLGNTSVNKGIRESLGDVDSHNLFPLFHNGITLLCDNVAIADNGESIDITNYVVVNGAQTVTTLHKDRARISAELRLPVRVIELNQKPDLAKRITQISNNQNAIKSRDLKANHQIQGRIKSDMAAVFGGSFDYVIKRGEVSKAKTIISNEEAGALFLSFDVQRPWNCHQLYRLFEDDYGEVFGRPEVNAHRVIFVWTLGQIVNAKLPLLKNKTFAAYRLTRFFLLYVVSRLLRMDKLGADIVASPERFMNEENWGARLERALDPILSSLIIDLNYDIDRLGDGFDYKSELKSPNRVRERADDLLKSYEKEVAKDKLSDFTTRWEQAGGA